VVEQLSAARADLDALLADPAATDADRAEGYGELGRLYHAYELHAAAAAAYRNAAALAPQAPGWVYGLALVSHAAGDLPRAEAAYRRGIDLRPDLVPALLHLAEILVGLDRVDEAEALIGRALELDPGSAAARALRGQVALSRRQYPEAAAALEEALLAVPDANRLHLPLAMAYRGLGDLERARQHLESAGQVGLRPPDAFVDGLADLKRGERLRLVRGRVAFRAGRYQDAAAEFMAAVDANPQSVEGHTNLAAALAQLGESAAAIEELNEVLRIDPQRPAARFNLGSLLLAAGKHEEAAAQLAEVVRLEPENPEAHRLSAAALAALGRHAEAVAALRAAVELEPDDERARLDEAVLLVRLERYREARTRLEELLARRPESGPATLALARLLAASPELAVRDGARAVELARRVFDSSPTPEHAATLAQALAESGACEEAANLQEELLSGARQRGWPASQIAALEQALARYRGGPPCRP
jgi:tetratricopeptide (TPR) repeat protein